MLYYVLTTDEHDNTTLVLSMKQVQKKNRGGGGMAGQLSLTARAAAVLLPSASLATGPLTVRTGRPPNVVQGALCVTWYRARSFCGVLL